MRCRVPTSGRQRALGELCVWSVTLSAAVATCARATLTCTRLQRRLSASIVNLSRPRGTISDCRLARLTSRGATDSGQAPNDQIYAPLGDLTAETPLGRSAGIKTLDNFLRLSPFVIVLTFFFVYTVAPYFALEVSKSSFVAADFSTFTGRPVADQVLISVAVPCVGILFATLASSTLGVLRGRQQEMRRILRQELILLDTLVKPVRKLFMSNAAKHRQGLVMLEQYALCVVAETGRLCNEETGECYVIFELFDTQKVITSSILDLIGSVDAELAESSNVSHAVVYSRVVSYANGLVNSLDKLRAARRATTTFTFPLLHWVILLFLGASLPIMALILAATFKSTSEIVLQDTLVRSLIGGVSAGPVALLCLLADLNEPYAGYVKLEDEPTSFAESAGAIRRQIKSIEC